MIWQAGRCTLGKPDFARMEEKASEVAETLSALANPNRLVILCQLTGAEKTVNELVESVALSQSAVSQHLSKLRALRLVKARRDGKNVHYAIASDAVAAIMQTLYKVYCSETPSRASR